MEEDPRDDDQALVHHKVAVLRVAHSHEGVRAVVHAVDHGVVHEVAHEEVHEVGHEEDHEEDQEVLEDVARDVDEVLVGRMQDSHVVLVLLVVLEVDPEVDLRVQEEGRLDHP